MKKPFATSCIFLFIGIIGSHLFKYDVPMYYVVFTILLSLVVFLFYDRGFLIFFLLTLAVLGGYIYNQSIQGDVLLNTGQNNRRIGVRILKEGIYKNGFVEYEVEILNLYLDQSKTPIQVNKNAQLKILSLL